MAFVYGLSAAIAFALMNFVLKHFCEEASPALSAFIRGLVGVVLLFPTFWGSRRIYITRAGVKIWLRSVAGAISVMCLFINLKQATVGDATMLSNLSPVFVILLQYFFLDERLRRNEIAGTLIVAAGVTSLSLPNVHGLEIPVLFTGLLGAMAAAVAYLTLKRASRDFTSRQIVWAFCLMMMVAASFFGGYGDAVDEATGVARSLRPWSELGWIVVAGLLGLVAQLLMTKAFTRLPALVAASLTLSMVVWGVVFESMWTRSLPGAGAMVSYGVVLGGLLVLQVRQVKFLPTK